MNTLSPGSRIGRFQISGLLGEGAMGVVYLAHDPQIERPVAIKTVRPQGVGGSSTELETRFLNEAKLAGRLQHPNIVTIYEAGQAEGLLYIAMEYVDGDALTHFLGPRGDAAPAVGARSLGTAGGGAAGALTLRERVEVIREAALALQHAHQRGVLHRDVKPGNILLTRDRRVKVADFGIGKLLTATVDLTRTGQMIGSPAYMSPEQIRGEKLDGRSDFFSLAVVFYELLTGRRPFPGDSITTLVYQILHTEPRDPLEIRSDLPPATRDVFSRLLAKSPDRRPTDAADFLREVRRIADHVAEPEQTITLPATVTAPVAAPAPAPAVVSGPRAASGPPTSMDARPAAVPLAAADAAAAAGSASGETAPPADRPPGPSGRSAGALYLFGLAAVLIALGFFVWTWRRSNALSEGPAGEPTAASGAGPVFGGAVVSPAPTPSLAIAAAAPTLAPPPTIGPLPTRGPATAADAVVGAPRYTGLAPTRAPRPTATESRVAAAPPLDSAAEPRGGGDSDSSPSGAVDNTYRTKRFAKFGVSPDQARMYVDGRYVGIADDWDDRGGGRKLEFTRPGRHHVRFELPGYRDLNVAIVVSGSASDETADVGDELKRESRQPYAKLSSPSERTVGPVVFKVDPPEATVSEGSRTLGAASSFGPDSPLKLHGPMVHDLVLSAPGRKSKSVRVLVAPNADSDRAEIKVELKKE
ncbi:MAG: serine/threonine-protein kinase [Acidobacteriota bacterium]